MSSGKFTGISFTSSGFRKYCSLPLKCKSQLYLEGHRLRLRRGRRHITQAITEQLVYHTRCLVPYPDQQQVGRAAMRARHRPFDEFLAHAALWTVRCVRLPLRAMSGCAFPGEISRQSFGAPHQQRQRIRYQGMDLFANRARVDSIIAHHPETLGRKVLDHAADKFNR